MKKVAQTGAKPGPPPPPPATWMGVLECRPMATSWSVSMGDWCMKLSCISLRQRRFPLLSLLYHHLELNNQLINPPFEQLSYFNSSIRCDPHLLTMTSCHLPLLLRYWQRQYPASVLWYYPNSLYSFSLPYLAVALKSFGLMPLLVFCIPH